MDFSSRFYECEGFAEQGGDIGGIATDDRQAAAAFGSIGSEAADDCVSAGCNGARGGLHVRLSCFGRREKVEGRAIVPKVETAFAQIQCRHVCDEPVDTRSSRAQALSGDLERGRREIDDGDRLDTEVEQVIHQRRRAAADVDDARARTEPGFNQQLERDVEVRAIPADLVRPLGPVRVVPMRAVVRHEAPAVARPQPKGLSIDVGGTENHFGPLSVMWMQSSSRTPKLPGM